ncbi:type II toxin-antitoxin system RelE/ParE family toxin [Patescibacteria group bacterium]|nr:type II toxin-antitoxin system RelE/ParE family toxin [Patescibacteria group bacterium]
MKVFLTPSALKQYNLLSEKFKVKVKKKLMFIEKNPYEGKKLSGKLSEVRYLRVWPYRILYYVDKKSKKIYVVTIAHRQGVYCGD